MIFQLKEPTEEPTDVILAPPPSPRVKAWAWVRPTDRDWVTRLQATYKEANRNDMLDIADPESA